jgi:hypothetical protein
MLTAIQFDIQIRLDWLQKRLVAGLRQLHARQTQLHAQQWQEAAHCAGRFRNAGKRQ